MSPFDSAYEFLFACCRNCVSCTIFKIASYLSKIPDLTYPPFGVALWNFTKLWRERTRVYKLLCGVICDTLCLAVLTELRLRLLSRKSFVGCNLEAGGHVVKRNVEGAKNEMPKASMGRILWGRSRPSD